MRRLMLVVLAVAIVSIAAAACGGGGGGGGGDSGGDHTATLTGTGFTADAGDMAYFRIFTGGTVAYCSSASIGGGNPSFSFTTGAVLGTKQAYTGELFVDIDANGGYQKNTDDEWKITIGKITSGTAAILTVDATDPQGAISWKANKGCPGK